MPDPNANPQPKSRVSVDSGGRILLPKKVRQRYGNDSPLCAAAHNAEHF
jgi:hypothetical protein